MNELLIGLAAVGALALGGLALYNRIEERRFKRQFDDEAMPDAADPLLDRPVGFASGEPAFSAPEAVAERREPHLSSEPADQGGGEESVSEPRVVVQGYDDAPPPAPRA